MLATDFVSVYPRVVEYQPTGDDALDSAMRPVIELSNIFGTILHDRLSDPTGPVIPIEANFIERYHAFGRVGMTVMGNVVNQITADKSRDPKEAIKARQRSNFHYLNGPMFNFWHAIADQQFIGNSQLYDLIPAMQDALAITGLNLYLTRQRWASQSANYAYFSEENSTIRHSLEGIGNEVDAGIVMLGIMRRHRDLVIVPSPDQFGHRGNHNGLTSQGKNRNVNFVAFSRDGRAVGAQLKSHVAAEDLDIYDHDRVVLIDARLDMGNQKAVRTTPGKSKVSVVTWSGVIAAQRAQHFTTHGAQGKHLKGIGLGDREILERKRVASQLVSDVKPRTHDAVMLIGDRIRERL